MPVPDWVASTRAGGGGSQPSSRCAQARKTSPASARTACSSSTTSTAHRVACPQAKYRRGAPAPPRYSRAARPATLAISGKLGLPYSVMNSSSSGSPVSELSRKAVTMSSAHRSR
jgi:hypothetical protein